MGKNGGFTPPVNEKKIGVTQKGGLSLSTKKRRGDQEGEGKGGIVRGSGGLFST